jgi:hypothetical protein
MLNWPSSPYCHPTADLHSLVDRLSQSTRKPLRLLQILHVLRLLLILNRQRHRQTICTCLRRFWMEGGGSRLEWEEDLVSRCGRLEVLTEK